MAEHQKVCEWCGSEFWPGKSVKPYCSGKCRAAASYASDPQSQIDKCRAWNRSKGQTDAAFHILNVMTQLQTKGET
jgi:ribosomal protein L24E